MNPGETGIAERSYVLAMSWDGGDFYSAINATKAKVKCSLMRDLSQTEAAQNKRARRLRLE